jgi:DMSO reductase anchor subunit
MGCKICTWACPYEAPVYNPNTGIIEKCTFCASRLEKEEKPACAHQCPVGALEVKRQEFPASEALKSSPVPVRVGSSLKVEELDHGQGPKMDASLFPESPIPEDPDPGRTSMITAAGEWSLLIFSLLSAFLVGLYAHAGREPDSGSLKILVMVGGVLSGGISLFHLGIQRRAWRSLAHVRRSWLSREILFFLLFNLSVFLDALVLPLPQAIPLALGLMLLISIDRLYSLAFWNWKLKIHSAQTLFLALSFFLLLQGKMELFLALGILRIVLYLFRKPKLSALGSIQVLSMSTRLLALLASMLMTYFNAYWEVSLLCFSLGEVLDRIEFYNELQVPSPRPGSSHAKPGTSYSRPGSSPLPGTSPSAG